MLAKGRSMQDDHVKTRNTKNLIKKLFIVAALITTYQIVVVEESRPDAIISDLAFSAVEHYQGNELKGLEDEVQPIEVTLNLSFDLDLGKKVNTVVRRILTSL